jgi:hypothetical protein
VNPSFWLASYPKSGNTWFRVLVANLQARDGEIVDLNRIDATDSIASARGRFDQVLMIESGLLHVDEIDALRPRLHAGLTAMAGIEEALDEGSVTDRLPVRLVKTHDAYTLTRRGEPLLGGRDAAAGAILIVRDPRDIAASFANHLGCDIDAAIAWMEDPDFALAAKTKGQAAQLRQLLTSWSGFVASWLDQRDFPVHLVRYEDLAANTAATFAAALAFAGCPTAMEAVAHAVARSTIEQLQRREAEAGFREAPRTAATFFRRGVAGGWRDELTALQVQRIEAAHAPMMERLGYAPAVRASARRVAGAMS